MIFFKIGCMRFKLKCEVMGAPGTGLRQPPWCGERPFTS
jgi:hypothetical protein